jgi:serine/threonine-protein kinase
VKVIDFGFGKKIDFVSKSKSISLNWRYLPPNEFAKRIYDFKTEIYFIGKLFEEILMNITGINFKYSHIINKMILDYEKRYNSFFDIYREIISNTSQDIDFSTKQKNDYLSFADGLKSLFSKIETDAEYKKEINTIFRELEDLYQNSILENDIQNINKLTRIFVTGNYKYFPKKIFKVKTLLDFIKLLKSNSEDRQKIILNNLWERLDSIERYSEFSIEEHDDLPF